MVVGSDLVYLELRNKHVCYTSYNSDEIKYVPWIAEVVLKCKSDEVSTWALC